MAKEELKEIIEWLDRDKNPLFIQLPKKILKKLNMKEFYDFSNLSI